MSASLGTVLITAKSVSDSDAAMQYLRDAGCNVQVETTAWPVDEAWFTDLCHDKAALVLTMEPVTGRLIDAAPHLKVIARPGVGYDTVDMVAANRRGVAVTIAAGANDQSVADFTMGLLLMAARGIGTAANSVAQGGWDRFVGTEVWNKTLAIIGLGRIGRAVAKRARGFDLRVLVVTRNPDHDCAAEHGLEFVTLERALRESDFVSLHAPLTQTTANLIDAASISMMKPGAYLINTSRGGLVDEVALAAAVRSGHLAGAAVDVLRRQGANSGSPLIGVPGVIVTPHMASAGREAMARVAMSVARSVVALLRGERPASVINPAALVPPSATA
jgi:phosphoglycerate dehydrogenase-like enzyme